MLDVPLCQQELISFFRGGGTYDCKGIITILCLRPSYGYMMIDRDRTANRRLHVGRWTHEKLGMFSDRENDPKE
jgi:hypothetical protein